MLRMGGSGEIYTLAHIIFDYLCVLKLYPISLIVMYTRIYNIKSPNNNLRDRKVYGSTGVFRMGDKEKNVIKENNVNLLQW